MRPRLLLAFCLMLSVGGSAQPDRLQALVDRLNDTHGLWVNGLYPEVPLPADVSHQQLVQAVFAQISFERGKVRQHQILEARNVLISGQTYTALALDTDQGPKIMLLQYQGERAGWWSRVYPNE